MVHVQYTALFVLSKTTNKTRRILCEDRSLRALFASPPALSFFLSFFLLSLFDWQAGFKEGFPPLILREVSLPNSLPSLFPLFNNSLSFFFTEYECGRNIKKFVTKQTHFMCPMLAIQVRHIWLKTKSPS